MISLPEFKDSLGTLAEKMTESEIENLRKIEDQLADLFFEQWLRKKNSNVQKPLAK